MTDKPLFTAPPVVGYRALSQEEVDLMNEIKQHGAQLQALIKKVDAHIAANAGPAEKRAEFDTWDTNPMRWLSIGRTDLQTGLMALTRAVARPTTF